jgi:TolA-binding protein
MNASDWAIIIVALIGLVGTIITVVVGNKKSAEKFTEESKKQTELTIYRIDQLEKKVNKHNNLIERTYKLELHEAEINKDIEAINARIDHLHKE